MLSEEQRRAVLEECHNNPGTGNHVPCAHGKGDHGQGCRGVLLGQHKGRCGRLGTFLELSWNLTLWLSGNELI